MIDMGGKTPRDYQWRCVEQCRQLAGEGKKWIIICAPTGSGKTFIACMFIKLARDKGKRSLFIAPSRELIKQTSEHLDDCGVRHSIIAAGFDEMPGSDCYVASKDTLGARTIRRNRMTLPEVDLLIVDEMHTTRAPEYMKLLAKFESENPKMKSLGLSATPGRADGKGLGDRWDSIVVAAGYEELWKLGYLVRARVFNAKETLDMRKVKLKDWDKEANIRVDKPKLVGDIVDHWKEHASGRPTIAFGATIAHAIHIRDAFANDGIRVEHLDQSTPKEERDQIIKDLKSGDIQVVTNCDVLSIGFDEPSVSCVILAAPTRSLVRYRQRAGRALRPHESKEDCLILDHSGASLMHGFPDEDIEWPLESSRNIDKEYQKNRKEGKTKEPMVCQNCGCMYEGRIDCPSCGHRQKRKARAMAIEKGLLREVRRSKANGKATFSTFEAKQKEWHRCLAVMARRGLPAKAAAGMYRSSVGEMPWNTKGLPNMPPATKEAWAIPVAELFPQYIGRSQHV